MNQLRELYRWFEDVYAGMPISELRSRVDSNIREILEMVAALSDEELFTPHQRKWADDAIKSAVWEVYKYIHVNTVTPVGSFRTKIRKWKN